MRSGFVPAALLLTLAVVGSAAGQAARTETLLTGEERTLAFEYAIGDVAIGNERVCDFRILPGRKDILLVSVAEGTTTLVLWDQKRNKRDEISIEVLSKEIARLKTDLVELLRFAPSVKVTTLGARLTLVGAVDSAHHLDRVQAIAAAAGSNVVSLVTLRPGASGSAPTSGAAPLTATPGYVPTPQPLTGTPPPASVPTARPGVDLGGAATPVSLGSGVPAAPAPPAAPPVAAPAPVAAAPPPPTVVTAAAPPPTVASPTPTVTLPPPPAAPAPTPPAAAAPPPAPSQPAAPPPAAAVTMPTLPPAPAAVTQVTYLIDLIEVPANSPPPDVMTPKGKKLTSLRIVATVGQPIRQFIDAKQTGALGDGVEIPKGSVAGISFGFQPSIEAGGALRTVMAIDTNLPFGQLPAPGPGRWTRAMLNLGAAAGRPMYLTEEALAGLLGSGQTYAAGAGPDGPNVVEVVGAVADTARAVPGAVPSLPAVPGGDYIGATAPLRGLFSRGGGGGPKPRDKALLIVITPYPGAGR